MAFWAKKAAVSGDDRGIAFLQRAHEKVKDQCSQCGITGAKIQNPLMKCGRCSMSYCE